MVYKVKNTPFCEVYGSSLDTLDTGPIHWSFRVGGPETMLQRGHVGDPEAGADPKEESDIFSYNQEENQIRTIGQEVQPKTVGRFRQRLEGGPPLGVTGRILVPLPPARHTGNRTGFVRMRVTSLPGDFKLSILFLCFLQFKN